MSIFSNLFTKTKVVVSEPKDAVEKLNEYLNFPTINYSESFGENISTIYTSCKILAEDVGSFPFNLYMNSDDGGKIIIKEDSRYSLLHYSPNTYTSSNTFFSTLEYIRNIRGNSFASINRDGSGKVKSLSIINPDFITGYKIVDDKLYYVFNDGNIEPYFVDYENVLHFKSLSNNGIWGINPIEKLRLNLSTTFKAFKTIDSFYTNNATSPMAIKTTIPEGINPKEWQAKVGDFASKYSGVDNSGKAIFLPPFTELQPISLNFADAEFIATIRFNADQIASLYRIPPHLVGNFESSKFNNLEQLQLNYKINTIRPILRMYRQELESKLLTEKERIAGLSIEFNTMAITENDSKTRIENLKNLFGMGVITPNQIAKWEGYEAYDGGDNHFLLTQLMSVEQYLKKTPVPPIS